MTKMQKKPKDEAESVMFVISSLYERYPEFRGCREVQTTETVNIRREIRKREAELQQDKKLVELYEKLKQEQRKMMEVSRQGRRKLDGFRNRLRLRGVSEQLIREIESFAKTEGCPEVNNCD